MKENKIYIGLTGKGKTALLLQDLDKLKSDLTIPSRTLIVSCKGKRFEELIPTLGDMNTFITWEGVDSLKSANKTLLETNMDKFDIVVVDEPNTLELNVLAKLISSPSIKKVFLTFQDDEIVQPVIKEMMKQSSIIEIKVLK